MIMNNHRYYIERQRIQIRKNSFSICVIIASYLCGPDQIPASTSYVSRAYCWFSPLHRNVFLRVLRFSPLLKNQHFQISIRSGKVDEGPLCGCASSKSFFLFIYLFIYFKFILLCTANNDHFCYVWILEKIPQRHFLLCYFLAHKMNIFCVLQGAGHYRLETPNFHINLAVWYNAVENSQWAGWVVITCLTIHM